MMDTANSTLVDALQDTAMLIRLSVSSFGTQATDKEKSREITDSAHASADAARVVLNKLPGAAKEYHKRITQVSSLTRTVINQYTTPWDESGWRLLVGTRFDPLMRQVSRLQLEFNDLREELRKNAPEVLEHARQALGDLEVKLPTAEEMVNAYAMKWDVMPIPDGAKFRGLPENVQQRLAERIEKQVAAAYEKGVASIMERVRPVCEAVVDRLQAFDERVAKQAQGEEVGRTGAFRDTLIYNIKPVRDLVHAMSQVDNDPRLTELCARLDAILQHEPQALRDKDDVRAAVKSEAKNIIAFFDSWDVANAA